MSEGAVVDTIKTIIAREDQSTEPYEDARVEAAIERELPALLGPGVGSILERRFRDYVIHIGHGGLRTLADDLIAIRALGVAAAPELVALLPLREGNVLVARYWVCPGERLLEVASTNARVTPEAAARFRRDMHVLAAHGKLHPYAGRGYNAWLVGERSGTIVLRQWTALRALSAHERDELLASLDRLLERRTEAP